MVAPHDSRHIAYLPHEEVMSLMGSDIGDGLDEAEVKRRLGEYGYNTLSSRKKKSIFHAVLKQLREPMILILVLVAVIYALVGSHEDAITIAVIVSIVIGIEAFNINRSERSVEALKQLTRLTCTVIRNGKPKEIFSNLLVPGDILVVSSGERIPADGRIIEDYSLKVDESSLTGESMPVYKEAEFIPATDSISDFRNMVFSGTLAVQGTGRVLVTATGRNTELGKISRFVEEAEEGETPLVSAMDRLALRLAYVALFFSIFIPLAGYLQGSDLKTMVLTGLSLAFAVIPEELPVIITLTLAVGAFALSKKKAIVKDLRAAETLGNVTLIATDKTGTITENTMTVSRISFPGKESEEGEHERLRFMEACSLATGNPSAEIVSIHRQRDPMERAVFDFSTRNGVDPVKLRKDYRPVEQYSFDNEVKMASYVYERDGKYVAYVSGAPEVVLHNSSRILDQGKLRDIEVEDIEKGMEELHRISDAGERIIAIAVRKIGNGFRERNEVENDLTFLGFISFLDPPREGIREALKQCSSAGIRVIMLTGDHARTARAIAERVGIDVTGEVVTGDMMNGMSDGELLNSIDRSSVFARITSGDKLRIVRLLEGRGEIVAVTGDGVNDAPALQSAQIGIAMGERGTDVARESSDLVLVDDNFNTIVEAVRVGRQIFHTLRKGVAFYMTVQFALVAIFLIPLVLSIPFPFSPIQIIVLEIFMDIGALWGFLSELPEKGIMQEKPRNPGKKFLDRSLSFTIIGGSAGLVVAVSVLYLFSYYSIGNVVEAQTTAFVTWVFAQVFLAMNFRTEREPVSRRGFFSNTPILVWGLAVVLLLVLISLFPGLQVFVHTASLTVYDWLFILLASFLSSAWIEAAKIARYLAGRRGRRVPAGR